MKRILPILLILVILFCGCAPNAEHESPPILSTPSAETEPISTQSPTPSLQSTEDAQSPPLPNDGNLQVLFFDVGQAECILVKDGKRAMLIDSGDIGQDELILGYLAEYGVTSLDILVCTHPHSDHIGSASAVIMAMDSVGTLLMPDVIHTTETFERLLDAIEEKSIDVKIPQPGELFYMGNARIQILAPNSGGYAEINDYSIVLRVEYGQSTFIFTGDAEAVSENEQLAAGLNLDADVLNIGHHGSATSSTMRYLEAVSPSYAVISCGSDNSYDHPHDETLKSLTALGVMLYRTDLNGTIEFTTDGETLTVSTECQSDTLNSTEQDNTTGAAASYIGNVNSKIFHRPTCHTLPAEKNRVHFTSRDEAVGRGYRACKNCNP